MPFARGSVTALHQACRRNNYRAAEALLSLGASATLKDSQGLYALAHAAASQLGSDTGLLRLVVNHGRDVDSVNEDGCSPLSLLAAWRDGTIDRLTFPIEYGADLNHRDFDGDTPLLNAVLGNKTALVVHLLQRGAERARLWLDKPIRGKPKNGPRVAPVEEQDGVYKCLSSTSRIYPAFGKPKTVSSDS
jgi:ankyrin repeat protein